MYSSAFAFLYSLLFSFMFAVLLLIINKIANVGNIKIAVKYRTYECGFLNSNKEAHKSLKVSYFFVGILFLLFDLEVLFLLPWVLNFSALGTTGLFIGFYFLLILIAGYIYELKCGFINWFTSSPWKNL